MSVCKLDINVADRTVSCEVIGAGKVTLHVDQLNYAIREYAMFSGLAVRLSRAAAVSRDETTGKPASPGAKFARVKAIADWYASGAAEWNLRGTSGRIKGLSADASILVEALMLQKPERDREALVAKVGTYTAAQVLRLRKDPSLVEWVAQVEEQMAANVDVDALMDDLG